jgi:hypothetical protein
LAAILPRELRATFKTLRPALAYTKYYQSLYSRKRNLASARCEIHLPAKAGSPLSLCL